MLAMTEKRETERRGQCGVTVLCCGTQRPGGLKTQTVCGGILFLMGSQEGQSGPQGRTDRHHLLLPPVCLLSVALTVYLLSFSIHTKT